MQQQIDWNEIREALQNTKKGNRRALVESYAQRLGVSKDTIYRQLRRRFGKQKIVKREKRIPQNLIDMIAKMKMQGMKMQIDERELSTEICIEKLRKRGVPGAELLTVSTVNRRLEESGFRLKDPIVRVEASYANQQHEMDFTRSKYFQLVGHDGTDWLLKVSGRELHYKQDDRRLRLWIVSVVDSYSRIELSRAYPATSESEDLGLSHLWWVYNREKDESLLNRLPDRFKTDQGSFAKSSVVRGAFERLNIPLYLSRPYSKRGIQKVESAHRRRWQQFELSLAIDLGPGYVLKLSEYNELLFEKCVADQDLMHPVRNDTRRGLYLSSLAAHPGKELDIDLREIAFRVWERKVRDTLIVTIDGRSFACPENTQGKWIRIYRNRLGEYVAHLVDEYHDPFILKPTRGFVELDDFEHRPHATYRQKMETEVERDMREGKRIFLQRKPQKVRPQTPVDRALEKADVFPNLYRAKIYIAKKLGVEYTEVAEIFDELLQEDLSKKSIDLVLKEIIRMREAN